MVAIMCAVGYMAIAWALFLAIKESFFDGRKRR